MSLTNCVAVELALSKHCQQTLADRSIKGLTRYGWQITSRLLTNDISPLLFQIERRISFAFILADSFKRGKCKKREKRERKKGWKGRAREHAVLHRWNITRLFSVSSNAVGPAFKSVKLLSELCHEYSFRESRCVFRYRIRGVNAGNLDIVRWKLLS